MFTTTESLLKSSYDKQSLYYLPKKGLFKTTASLARIIKKTPLSYHETYSIKQTINFSKEKESKSLYDTRNRNRSNPHPGKIYVITIQQHPPKEHFDHKQILLDNIINQRKKAGNIISSFIKKKMIEIKTKKQALVRQLIQMRLKMIIRIQSLFKGFLIRKDMKCLIACDMVFFYEINENVIHKLSMEKEDNFNSNDDINLNSNDNNQKRNIDIKLNLISNSQQKNKEISFSYSKSLKCHYLGLLKKGVIKKKYKANIIINNQTVIDPRYEVDNDDKGNFYNIINKSMLHDLKKKNKTGSTKPPIKLYWETIFKMKSQSKRHSNSCDSLSVSNNTELSNEYFSTPLMPIFHSDPGTPLNIKPILKKNSFLKSESHPSCNKRNHVKFNTTIQYSY